MDTSPADSNDLQDSGLQHLDALYGYAFTLTRQKTEAEDLVQETYLRAVRNRGQFVPGTNLKAWLFVIMRNAWLNQVRHDRNGPRFLDLEEPDSLLAQDDRRALNNPHVIYMRKVERNQVRSAIESLPAAHREIVILRDIEGFSYQEIATMLACPAGTVMSRLGRAREKLRKILTSEPRARAKGV